MKVLNVFFLTLLFLCTNIIASGYSLNQLVGLAEFDLVKLRELVESGEVDINQQFAGGETALMMSSRENKTRAVNNLLSLNEINPNLKNEKGNAAINIAVLKNHIDLMQIFSSYPNVDLNIEGENEYSPLVTAIRNNQFPIIRILLDSPYLDVNFIGEKGYSALMMAALYGYRSTVQLLLSVSDIDINLANDEGWTAVLFAANVSESNVVDILINDKRINLHHRNLILRDYGYLLELKGHKMEVSDLLQYIDAEVSKAKYNNGINSLIGESSKVLLIDSMITELNYENLLTQGRSIFSSGRKVLGGYHEVSNGGSHGDLTSDAVLQGGIDGMNFIEIHNDPSYFCRKSKVRSIKTLISNYKPDVINESCGYSDEYRLNWDLEIKNKMAEDTKTILVTSAGNSKTEIPELENKSDYYFVIGSVDGTGMLTDRDEDSGSNYGQGVDFTARSFDLTRPAIFTTNQEDTVLYEWGGTSYAAPVVTGLIARMLNYLPIEAKRYPGLVKKLIVENGDYSPLLEGKVRHPIIVNGERTINNLRSRVFFPFKIEQGVLKFKCDKRLRRISLWGNKLKCHSGKTWMTIKNKKYWSFDLNVFFKPSYSEESKARCSLDFTQGNSVFPKGEGILDCSF
jgi:ankyrin repeat protein